MELISVYLYNRIPIETENLNNRTFHSLKSNGWYSDTRTNRKFTMLNKRFESGGKWYRALVRFENTGIVSGIETFSLSIPAPFLITECEPLYSASSARWKDTKTYHGPRIGSVHGYMEAGVPVQVIDEVYADLKEFSAYNTAKAN